MFCIRTVARISVLVVGLATCAVAHAQSAADGFDPGANDVVWNWALQPDGKILVVGAFTNLGGGGTGATTRNRIGRLNADGLVDAAFAPSADAPVKAVAVQPDGKILVGGSFTLLNGGAGPAPRNHIGRLHPNGVLDVSFDPNVDADVLAIVLQPDG